MDPEAQNPWAGGTNGARSLGNLGSNHSSLLGPLLFVVCIKLEDIAGDGPAAQNKFVSWPNEVNPRH